MPVVNEKKYEITFKNLRHREIACLVQAVPQKNSKIHSYNNQDKKRPRILKTFKKKLNGIPSTFTKNSKLSNMDKKSELTSKITKKRVPIKNRLGILNSPKKQTSIEVCDSTSANVKSASSPVFVAEKTSKRSYQKKTASSATITPITDGGQASSSTGIICFGVPVIAPESETIYRKKLKIPAVPHNTPVMCQAPNDNNSTTSTSPSFFLSRPSAIKHCKVITIGKRGRGRPRLSAPLVNVVRRSEESRTSHKSRGSSKSGLGEDTEAEEPDQEVSEYERLRLKNIEENLKKLRELFSEQGLHFEKKTDTSDTPKKSRKSYSRIPLPPPRPKSQRMVQRSSLPLDFCSLDEKLLMSESAFM